MSRSYWRVIPAVVGLSLAIPAAAQISSPFPDPGPPSSWGVDEWQPGPRIAVGSPDVEERGSEIADNSASTADESDGEALLGQRDDTAPHSQELEADPKYYERNDLTAQQQMAEATQALVTIGWVQFFTGLGGIAVVAWTLYYTRQNAVAAIEAVKATGRSVDALMGAERPHMNISELKIASFNGPNEQKLIPATISRKFTNYGRSPAFIKRQNLSVLVVGELPALPDYQKISETRYVIAVNGWFGTPTPNVLALSEAHRDKIMAGEAGLFVFGLLEYEDTFGILHKNRHCYRIVFKDDWSESERYVPDGPDSYWEYT